MLVTGGAGYIGSHTVRALAAAGHAVTVLDDLSSGHAASVPDGVPLVRADVTAPGALASALADARAEALVHFAARIQVGESVARPDLYYATNVGGMVRVCEAAAARRIPVVFSSTAAVYGAPERLPIPIDHPCRPESPYGQSKRIGELMLADTARAFGFGCASLRYFNAAGAAHGLDERHHPETHLVPLAIDAALGRGPELALFGEDWPTEDGTCVRDYVHVLDLAEAHVRALDHVALRREAITLNLGAGRGVTVRQVLDAVARAVGKPVPARTAARRPGDVAQLVADIAPARALLGWEPRRSTIDAVVADALTARR